MKKDYKLHFQKENGICIVRKEKESKNIEGHQLADFSKLKVRHISKDFVENQLANLSHIGFEVTDACNLKCTYCAYRELYNNYDKRENRFIDLKKSKTLIDYVIEKFHMPKNYSANKDVIITFYGGEPLLNINHIKEYAVQL